MTCIIILGENMAVPGAFDGTEQLVNYHVDVTGARITDQLEARLMDGRPASLKNLSEMWPLSEYKATVAGLNATRPLWSIRDDRVLLFLAEFAKMVGDARLLWVDTKKPVTDYEKALDKLNSKAFEGFSGKKLAIKEAGASLEELL